MREFFVVFGFVREFFALKFNLCVNFSANSLQELIYDFWLQCGL